ncbi:CocE/NonD family hydrolase, partial [Hyella patelloides]
VGYDLYSDWAYENGAFCLQANLGWAIQLAAETARLNGDETAYQKLYAASRNLPLKDKIPANPDIMPELAADSFYHDWLRNPQPGEYWEKLSPKHLLQDVDLPMLHIGGWFDPYLRGTLNLYQAMSQKSKYAQHLIIAPWAHLPWGRKLGAVDYGMEAQNFIDEIQIRWFDHFLKGKDTGILAEAPISLFEMGSNQWRYWKEFPEQATTYYLASDGLAGMKEYSGMLWEYQEEEDNLIAENSNPLSTTSQDLENYLTTDITADFDNTKDIIVHDPWRPVPVLGGHASFPGGSCDRSSLDCRSDILTYTSYPLETDLHITGIVIVELYCDADKPSFDLCAVLSEVHADGKVFNFTQGYTKIDSVSNPVTIPLQATCMKLTAGNSLRLSLSAACFPAYPVNSGTGKSLLESRLIDNQIITISIMSGADYPSLVRLKTVLPNL